jgi:hypothetical protein
VLDNWKRYNYIFFVEVHYFKKIKENSGSSKYSSVMPVSFITSCSYEPLWHTVVTEGKNAIGAQNINIQSKMLSYGLPSCRGTLGDTGASKVYLPIYLTTTVKQQRCCGVE